MSNFIGLSLKLNPIVYKVVVIFMGKFSYEENEIKIGKYQCDFCRYKYSNVDYRCSIFGEVPNDILVNERACIQFSGIEKDYFS